MATLWYGHFNSTPDDPRKLQAYEWARYISSFITDGIRNGGTCLQVTADSSMFVKVDEGVANVRGYIMRVDEDYEGRYHRVLVPEAHDRYPRIDRIVLRLDLDPGNGMAGALKPVALRGVAAASPVPPPLTRNANVWELSLARVRVAANALTIAPADITDERFDTELCGIINSILGLDPSVWQAQFDAFMAAVRVDAAKELSKFIGELINKEEEFQAMWDVWFAGFEHWRGELDEAWQAQMDEEQRLWLEQMAEQADRFQSQCDAYAAWKQTIDTWRDLTVGELAMQVSFSFDNQFAFPGTVMETVGDDDGGLISVLRYKAVDRILAEQVVTDSGDVIAADQKVYNPDGSIFRHVKMTVADMGTRIVSEVEGL